MDLELWQSSLLGAATAADRGGPGQARQRTRARAHIGRRLRDWREGRGLSQHQAHAELGLSGRASRMHALETGEVPWTTGDVNAVAAALGTDAEELVREVTRASDPDSDRRRASFTSWAANLSDAEWQQVISDVNRRRNGEAH